MEPRSRRREWRSCALASAAWLTVPAAAWGQASTDRVQVQATGNGCPDAAMLQAQLAPVLPGRDAAVSDAVAGSASERSVIVRDLGERYAVELDDAVRNWSDPQRDCVERARVAAVFIALNLELAQQPTEGEPPGQDEGVHLGLSLFGRVAHATEPGATTGGGGLGGWLDVGSLRGGVDLSLLAPVRLELEQDGQHPAAVELLRASLDASVAYLWRGDGIAFGPFAGAGADLLRVQGANVAQPEHALRLSPSLGAGARLELALGDGLRGLLRVALHFAPRPNDLSVEPLGKLGRVPPLWLDADLGLGWQL